MMFDTKYDALTEREREVLINHHIDAFKEALKRPGHGNPNFSEIVKHHIAQMQKFIDAAERT